MESLVKDELVFVVPPAVEEVEEGASVVREYEFDLYEDDDGLDIDESLGDEDEYLDERAESP